MLDLFIDANGDINSAGAVLLGASLTLFGVVFTAWINRSSLKKQLVLANAQKVFDLREKKRSEIKRSFSEILKATTNKIMTDEDRRQIIINEMCQLLINVEFSDSRKERMDKVIKDLMDSLKSGGSTSKEDVALIKFAQEMIRDDEETMISELEESVS